MTRTTVQLGTHASQWLLAGLTGLALLAGLGFGTATPADALSRKVNEYEGQHRLAITTGEYPE